MKKGEKIKVKIVDISVEERKILVSKKALEQDPMEFWASKKIDDILTTKVISVDKKGLLVKPEGSESEVFIKKNQIAIQNEDARSERFTVSDRVDAAIIELSLEKRKVGLSIKRVEEINKITNPSKTVLQAIGMNLSDSLEENINMKTKRLAKKQITWFKKESKLQMIETEDEDRVYNSLMEIINV